MPVSYGYPIDQVSLQFLRHTRCPFAAHANEPNAPGGQILYRGNSDVLSRTGRNDLAFVETNQKRAAHGDTPRR